ncbi:MAG: hypothetical protein U1F45_02030 [Burkholderiales bacterium]
MLKRGWGAGARRASTSTPSTRQHLIELINDILDLSKVEMAAWRWSCCIDCEPHKVIREVVKVSRRAREKGVIAASEAATPLPAKIQSDPGRLRQIVTNLAGNALFTERGGCAWWRGCRVRGAARSSRST